MIMTQPNGSIIYAFLSLIEKIKYVIDRNRSNVVSLYTIRMQHDVHTFCRNYKQIRTYQSFGKHVAFECFLFSKHCLGICLKTCKTSVCSEIHAKASI